MSRLIQKFILVAAVVVLACAQVSSPSDADQFRHPIQLGDRCKAEFERFMGWQEHHKVFAYGVGPREYACAADVEASLAIEKCNETRGYWGRCKVYAKSRVDGTVKIVWDGGSLQPAEERRGIDAKLVGSSGSPLLLSPSSQSKRLGVGGSVLLLGHSDGLKRSGGERELNQREAIEIESQKISLAQSALKTLGLYRGRIDGVDGPKTQSAFNIWLMTNGKNADVKLTYEIVVEMRRQAQTEISARLAEAKAEQERQEPPKKPEEVNRREVQDNARAELRRRHKHSIAVIIGNHDYTGRTPDVTFAGRDADAVRDYVVGDLGYRDGNVIDVRNASLTQLNETFGTAGNHRGRLFDYVRPNKSDVIVFYSGHGVPGLRDRKDYLLPVNADPNRAELNGYPLDMLLANLAMVPARSMAVYIDACFSGESQKGLLVRATSGITVQAKIPKLLTAMVVVTAAQNDQLASWDEDAKHGLFTKHLLEALRGKADEEGYGDGDGKVTLDELRAYLDEEMTYQARRRWSRDQNASVQGADSSVLATLH